MRSPALPDQPADHTLTLHLAKRGECPGGRPFYATCLCGYRSDFYCRSWLAMTPAAQHFAAKTNAAKRYADEVARLQRSGIAG